jgi:hypothetical protein
VIELWSLGDVLDAIEILDIMDELEERQLELDARERKRKAGR